MKHVPLFRWVVTFGLVLVGCSLAVYLAAPGYPELRQVDLTVVREDSDGSCAVRWNDPFDHRPREGAYLCDPDRDPLLKAPDYRPGTGLGYDSGFVVAKGAEQGELYSLERDGATDRWLDASHLLLSVGMLLLIVGAIGGNVRSLSRLSGVSPGVVRRAAMLRDAAAGVARDHRRAVAAVREAWEPLHEDLVRERLRRIPVARLRRSAGTLFAARELERGGIRSVQDVLDAGARGVARSSGLGRRTAEKMWAAACRKAREVADATTVPLDADPPDTRTAVLLNALRVLVEAGPEARHTAEEGVRLAGRLERRLIRAAPAAGWRPMLDAGREERRQVPGAVTGLRLLLEEARRDGAAERFAQTSVDLLRGADGDPAGLAARVDFESRPARYYALLADLVGPAAAGGRTAEPTADGPGPSPA